MKSVYSAVRTGSCKWSGLRFVFKWLTHPFSWPVQCILFKAVPVPWILITSIYVRYRILRRLRPLQGVLHILRVASCIIGIVSIPVSYSGNRGLRILAPNPCLVRDSSWYSELLVKILVYLLQIGHYTFLLNAFQYTILHSVFSSCYRNYSIVKASLNNQNSK